MSFTFTFLLFINIENPHQDGCDISFWCCSQLVWHYCGVGAPAAAHYATQTESETQSARVSYWQGGFWREASPATRGALDVQLT